MGELGVVMLVKLMGPQTRRRHRRPYRDERMLRAVIGVLLRNSVVIIRGIWTTKTPNRIPHFLCTLCVALRRFLVWRALLVVQMIVMMMHRSLLAILATPLMPPQIIQSRESPLATQMMPFADQMLMLRPMTRHVPPEI